MTFTTMRIDQEVLTEINKLKRKSRKKIGEMESANDVMRRVLNLAEV